MKPTYILSYMPACGADRAYAGTVEASNENEAHALGCAFGIFPEGTSVEGWEARIMEYPMGHNVRSKDGARLSYHPEWSWSQPWASFKNGTAGRHFATLSDGVRQLTRDGYRFDKDATKIPA